MLPSPSLPVCICYRAGGDSHRYTHRLPPPYGRGFWRKSHIFPGHISNSTVILMNANAQNHTSHIPVLGCYTPLQRLTITQRVNNYTHGRETDHQQASFCHELVHTSCLGHVCGGQTPPSHLLNYLMLFLYNNYVFLLKKTVRLSILTITSSSPTETHS